MRKYYIKWIPGDSYWNSDFMETKPKLTDKNTQFKKIHIILRDKIGLSYHSGWIAIPLGNRFNSNLHKDSNLAHLNFTHRPFQFYNSSLRHSPKHKRRVVSVGLSWCALCYSCIRLQRSTAQIATILRGSAIGKVALRSEGHVEEGFRPKRQGKQRRGPDRGILWL